MGSGVWDQRRRVHRNHNERVRSQDRWSRWIVGSAALDMHENEPPPKTRVYLRLCDGLMTVIRVYYWRFTWWYRVMIGRTIHELTEADFLKRWAVFYAQFESAAGVNAGKQTIPTAIQLLPAPQQPIALLPSGA